MSIFHYRVLCMCNGLSSSKHIWGQKKKWSTHTTCFENFINYTTFIAGVLLYLHTAIVYVCANGVCVWATKVFFSILFDHCCLTSVASRSCSCCCCCYSCCWIRLLWKLHRKIVGINLNRNGIFEWYHIMIELFLKMLMDIFGWMGDCACIKHSFWLNQLENTWHSTVLWMSLMGKAMVNYKFMNESLKQQHQCQWILFVRLLGSIGWSFAASHSHTNVL